MKRVYTRQIFEKYSDVNFNEHSSSGGSRVVPCGQTDGRTGRHDKTNSHFLKFGEHT